MPLKVDKFATSLLAFIASPLGERLAYSVICDRNLIHRAPNGMGVLPWDSPAEVLILIGLCFSSAQPMEAST